MSKNDKKEKPVKEDKQNLNADWQGVDKDPAEEKGKAEQVTKDDLKAKRVDADPEEEKKKE